MMLGVPAAGAGSGDVQAVRATALSFEVNLLNGSPTACRMMIPSSQSMLVRFASFVARKTVESCPVAVRVLAVSNASRFPNRAAYVRAAQAVVNAVSRGKVKLTGSDATIDFYNSRVHSLINLTLTNGHWRVSLFEGAITP
jgi:hypothetical protein